MKIERTLQPNDTATFWFPYEQKVEVKTNTFVKISIETINIKNNGKFRTNKRKNTRTS